MKTIKSTFALRSVVLFFGLYSLGLPAVEPRQPQAIKLTVKQLKRLNDTDVALWVEAKNYSKAPVLLLIGSPDAPLDFQSLVVDQWDPKEGWKFVGPWGHDVPPTKILKLQPGESATGMALLTEIRPVSRGGGRISFQGKHRVEIWYFRREDEDQVRKGKYDNYRVARSKPFHIPTKPPN